MAAVRRLIGSLMLLPHLLTRLDAFFSCLIGTWPAFWYVEVQDLYLRSFAL